MEPMGGSHGNFTKYPRTPHLFGSTGTADDKHMGQKESLAFISDESLIVEEKLDGTNVGIHFDPSGRMILQCRGHEITSGMHPQYDLFKQWCQIKRPDFEEMLTDRLILFGEWMYARHSVHYLGLNHYFQEFDVYDKRIGAFLDYRTRMDLIVPRGIETVPILHSGQIDQESLSKLIGPSRFRSRFENPVTGKTDDLMEGLYLRTEAGGVVTGRAKFVRPEFVLKINQSEHWQHQMMVPNTLADGSDIWK